MYEQNYNAPIGSVTNIDIGELTALLPKGAKLTQRTWLAATLVDRQPQFEAIVDRIDAMIDKDGGGKLLIVVRGIRPDIHHGLVLRCGLTHFDEYYDTQNGWNYLGRVPWPRGADSVQSVLRKLGEVLAFPKTMRSQVAIEGELAKLQKSLCFSHYLDAAWWTERDQRLVLDWVDYVCHGWPGPPCGRLMVTFLCLDYGKDGENPFASLLAELRRRVGRDRPDPILLTDPLDLITASDVDDWVSEVGRFLKLPSVEGPLLNAANELFSPTLQRLRLADVYKKLCEKLARVLPAGPTFTTADQ